jgi:hypothetical protein
MIEDLGYDAARCAPPSFAYGSAPLHSRRLGDSFGRREVIPIPPSLRSGPCAGCAGLGGLFAVRMVSAEGGTPRRRSDYEPARSRAFSRATSFTISLEDGQPLPSWGSAPLRAAQGRVTSLRLHPCPPTAPGASCGILDPGASFARMQAVLISGSQRTDLGRGLQAKSAGERDLGRARSVSGGRRVRWACRPLRPSACNRRAVRVAWLPGRISLTRPTAMWRKARCDPRRGHGRPGT